MSIKDFKLRNDDEIIVELKSEETGQNPFRSKKNSLIRPSKETDYIPRRIKPGFIKFFDLGRLADGTDVDFLIQPALSDSINPIRPSATLADHQSKDAFFLEFDPATLNSEFYEITQDDGDLYQLVFAGDGLLEETVSTNPNWTENGFKLSAGKLNAANFRFYVGNTPLVDLNAGPAIFPGLKLDGDFRSKVTNAPDYDADDLPSFRLKPGDIIFLVPALVTTYGEARSNFNRNILNYDLRLAAREFYFSNEYDGLISPNSAEWFFDVSSDPYGVAYKSLQKQSQRPDARAWRASFGDPYLPISPSDVLPTAQFPAPPGTPNFFSRQISSLLSFNNTAGILSAIVRRGNNHFYIWTA